MVGGTTVHRKVIQREISRVLVLNLSGKAAVLIAPPRKSLSLTPPSFLSRGSLICGGTNVGQPAPARAPLSTQHSAGELLFENLHDRGGRAALGLTDEQVYVIGHGHVTDHDELVALAHLFQNLQKQVAAARGGEPALTMVTTAGEKVQVIISVVALQACRHNLHCRVSC